MHMNHLLYVYFSNDSPCNISKCNFVIFFIPKGGDIWGFFVEKQFLFNILVPLDMSKCFLFWFILPMVLDARKSVLCVCKIIKGADQPAHPLCFLESRYTLFKTINLYWARHSAVFLVHDLI